VNDVLINNTCIKLLLTLLAHVKFRCRLST